MDDEKRKIIVGEIKHWRRSKLLPEQYCDFLLNLYHVDAETSSGSKASWRNASSPWQTGNWIMGLMVAAGLILTVITLLPVFNFNLPVQIGVSSLFIVFCYIVGVIRRHRSPLQALGLSGLGSLTMLVSGLWIISSIIEDQTYIYIVYISVCAAIWIAIGLLKSMRPLHFCGWVALMFAYGWLLHQQMGAMQWTVLQLSYVPIAFLFIWIGWMIHHRSKSVASVWMLTGLLVWFIPEPHGLILSSDAAGTAVQASLIGKLLVTPIIVFVLRKKWMEWVVHNNDQVI